MGIHKITPCIKSSLSSTAYKLKMFFLLLNGLINRTCENKVENIPIFNLRINFIEI